jgi:hypothetical protein
MPTPALERSPFGPSVRRLLAGDPHLLLAYRRLHRCGPQPVAMFFAETLDCAGADPALLDLALTWCAGWDPDVVRAIAGDFPPSQLHQVPR